MYTSEHHKRRLNCDSIKPKELGDENTKEGMCDNVKNELKKRKGGFMEVEVITKKKLLVYFKEEFNFDKEIVSKEDGKYADLRVVYQTAPGCALDELVIDEEDMSVHLTEKDRETWKGVEMTFGYEDYRAIVVMPKEEIKKTYTEGENLDELRNYLVVPMNLTNAFKRRTVKVHPDGCRCKKCKDSDDSSSDSE